MNYLAHAYLGSHTPELILGSILGDFVKGPIRQQYAPAICDGIALHRQIDCYTDQHPVVQTSKRLISPQRRRLAGIMVDLFYDHFLAKHWLTYSSIPLGTFTQQVYQILWDRQELLPSGLRTVLPAMAEQNWLASYQDIQQIGRALDGLSRRLRQPNLLLNSVEELEHHYGAFERDFQLFFPNLIDFVAKSMASCPL